jgi:hypothetical protein
MSFTGDTHVLREDGPHGFLPCQKVFLGGTGTIVCLANFTKANSTSLVESLSNFSNDAVVMLVGLIAQAKSNIGET